MELLMRSISKVVIIAMTTKYKQQWQVKILSRSSRKIVFEEMSAEPCLLEIYDDLDVSHRCIDESEVHFAEVVGFIEEIILDEKFLQVHQAFMESYWKEFDDSEENKLIYMEIFKKYVDTIEKYIETELMLRIPDFSMVTFESELRKRQTDLDGEIFEILSTFTDFISFKEKFLDYKQMKEGKLVDFSKVISVIKYEVEGL